MSNFFRHNAIVHLTDYTVVNVTYRHWEIKNLVWLVLL